MDFSGFNGALDNHRSEEAGERAETILLVEDEDFVRNVTSEVLEMAGYKVLQASNAAEGIKLFDRHAGDVHLLVTDVIMPGMNGRDLALTLKGNCPELRTIYMSGYTQNIVLQDGDSDETPAYLQKPFSLETLVQKVREVLESRSATHFRCAVPLTPEAADGAPGMAAGLR